jgi:tetrahydromethanopterin S-methyltransferase subunit C
VGGKSTAELLSDLSTQLTGLIRQEVDLAKAELSQKTKRLGFGAGFLGMAGLLAVFALGALVAAAIASLQLLLPLWAAAVIVGVATLVVAAILALMGKSEVRQGAPPVPEQALQSTKEDAAWLKTQTRSAKP